MALTSRVLVGALALIAVVPASSAAVPDSARTLAYINRTWSTLTRSATSCASYRSPYYHGKWVLYLPHDLPMPPAVRALRAQCDVSVLRLPVRITKLGGFQPTLLKDEW